MGGDVFADFGDLLGQIAQEGCGAVGGRVGGEADEVGVGARVRGIGEGAYGAEAVGFVIVT